MWKLPTTKWIALAVIYVAFFSLIGLGVYISKSAAPLWALLLTPSWSTSDEDDDENEKPKTE